MSLFLKLCFYRNLYLNNINLSNNNFVLKVYFKKDVFIICLLFDSLQFLLTSLCYTPDEANKKDFVERDYSIIVSPTASTINVF